MRSFNNDSFHHISYVVLAFFIKEIQRLRTRKTGEKKIVTPQVKYNCKEKVFLSFLRGTVFPKIKEVREMPYPK